MPLTSVTPLYGFSTDSERLVISDNVTITHISDEQLQIFSPDDVFMQFVRLHQPQHLLWKTVDFSLDHAISIIESLRQSSSQAGTPLRCDAGIDEAHMAYVLPVSRFLNALHLFNPGRLVAGDTSFFANTEEVRTGTLSLARCSEMVIDFQFVQQFSPHYQFNAADVPFFLAFRKQLDKVWPAVQMYPQIELALYRYANESAQYGDAVNLIVALEALLVPETEGITYRLCQRVANLLGSDAASRKELFRRVTDFYSLRSKMVHGAKLKSRDIDASQELDKLREITRRVILSVIALASEIGLRPEVYGLFNDMCLDDDLRKTMQTKASALLNIQLPPSSAESSSE